MSTAYDDGDIGPYTAVDLHAREGDGKGFELEDGWLTELSPSAAHNFAYRRIHELLEVAIEEVGASVYADRGGWEISTPVDIRRPDFFAVPAEVIRTAVLEHSVGPIPGRALLLVGEVVSPGSRSERTDRVRKPDEYAALGIPHYWIVDTFPTPKVQVLVLDDETGTYRLEREVRAGEVLEVEVEADKPFTVRFDPRVLTEF